MKKYKYVYVYGRLDSEENEWELFSDTTEAAAVKKFINSTRRTYGDDEGWEAKDVYIEVVVLSNTIPLGLEIIID